MFAKERQAQILKLLKSKGVVTTVELIEIFKVSIETVRRDLLQLEKLGTLQRVHGGAILYGEMRPFEDLAHRIENNKHGKAELCETAAMLINDNDIICIESGSTAILFAEAIKRRLSRLTVITNGLDIFDILSVKEGFNVILCGGHYLKKERAFYGQITLDTLKNLHVQKAFIFPSAVSLKNGICDFNHELQQVQLQIMSCGDKIFVLADSEKFEKNALLKLSDMNANYTYVTDSKLSPHYKQLYLEQNLNIITSKQDILIK